MNNVDRSALIEQLNRAVAAGQIDEATRDQSLAAIVAARTEAELTAIAAALPREAVEPRPGEAYPFGAPEPISPAFVKVILITVAVMVIIAVLGVAIASTH